MAVCAVTCALLLGAIGPVGGTVAITGVEAGSDLAGVGQVETPSNETVRHENPETVDQPGDLAAVEGYLAGRLSDRLDEASLEISQEQYAAARSVLGEGYDDQLAVYVDVVGATESEDDDEAADAFGRAGTLSESFANETEAYEEEVDAYQRAIERGDAERARALARGLLERSGEVGETGDRLRSALRSIETRTGQNLSGSRERVLNVSESVEARAAEIANRTFVATSLEARASPTDISFLRPATVRGRLVDENGSPLSNRTVRIGEGADAVTAQTNASGTFNATYRPVRLPVTASNVTVTYSPQETSIYLGDSTTSAVFVSPVVPSVTARAGTDAVAYRDSIRVSGTVSADGVAVTGLPVSASIDGVQIATGMTNASGGYALEGRLPAAVATGQQSVVVGVDQTDRAVAHATGSDQLDVASTATSVSVTAEPGDGRDVEVSGRLRTASGVGIGGQAVAVLVNDRVVETVSTGEDGRYSTSVTVSSGAVGENNSVVMVTRFDGGGTNLEGATARTTVELPMGAESVAGDSGPGATGSGTVSDLIERPLWQWLLGIALLGLVLLGGRYAWRRGTADRSGSTEAEATPGSAATNVTVTDESESVTGEPNWREAVDGLLEQGQTDRAVTRTYGELRKQFSLDADTEAAMTHWEFYSACRDNGLGAERLESLRALTAAYERARFAAESVDATEAGSTVDEAAVLLEG